MGNDLSVKGGTVGPDVGGRARGGDPSGRSRSGLLDFCRWRSRFPVLDFTIGSRDPGRVPIPNFNQFTLL